MLDGERRLDAGNATVAAAQSVGISNFGTPTVLGFVYVGYLAAENGNPTQRIYSTGYKYEDSILGQSSV